LTQQLFRWDWVLGRPEEIAAKLGEHLWLTFLAVVIGLAISFPLAIAASRSRRVLTGVTGVSGLLYTIPSLALFAALVPFTGLSVLTAEIGLVGYTLLILIRNIVAGLQGVPSEAKESARGMGLTERQILWRVEIPLAIPAIVAGIRIATVTTIGLVTVTSLLNLGGLGHYILLGLQRGFPTAVLLGVALSVALALFWDATLLMVERLVTPWRSRAAGGT
jgi:osmoprotectant transport system permease protein